MQKSTLAMVFRYMHLYLFAAAVDLSKAITPDVMIPILANAEVRERLLPFLPQGDELPRSEEELRNTVSSPQFQQVGHVSCAESFAFQPHSASSEKDGITRKLWKIHESYL